MFHRARRGESCHSYSRSYRPIRIARQELGRNWRLKRLADEPPLSTVGKIKSAMRLTALNAPAFRLGLNRGQALAEARAIYPLLEAIEADPAS